MEEENKLNENNAEEEINVCRGIPSVGAKSGAVGLNNFAVRRNYEQNGGEHKNERTNQGLIRSTSAHGGMTLSSSAIRKIQTQSLEQLMHRTGVFEFFWYPIFIVLGLACLVLVPIFTTMTNMDILLLVFSVLSLWLGMTGNNLVAKGYRVGLLLTCINMVLYVVVSAFQKVWGEVIINTLVYLPLALYSFFKWKQDAIKKAEKGARMDDVEKMNGKQLLLHILLLIGLTASVWAVLKYGLNQAFAIFNAISIAGCIVGDIARTKRYIETWFFYMLCNIGGIVLWALQIFASGNVSLAVLPAMISFMATLSNNFNGVYIWGVLYKNTHRNGGVYLAMRPVNIKGVAKLKRTYRKMVCNETEKYVSPSAQPKKQKAKKNKSISEVIDSGN